MEYEELRDEFCESWKSNANDNHLWRVLNDEDNILIRDIIDSSRVLESITGIDRLFKVLHRRNEDNVETLRNVILFAVDLKKTESWLINAKRKVDNFKKQRFNDGHKSLPHPLKLPYELESIHSDVDVMQCVPNATREPNGMSMQNQMDYYFDYICGRIGTRWIDFFRHLPNVTERQLNDERRKYNDEILCRTQILRMWIAGNKNDPNIFNKSVLIKTALNCQFHDIANGLAQCN